MRRIAGLDLTVAPEVLSSTAEQEELGGIYLIVGVGDMVIGIRTHDVVEVLPDENVVRLPNSKPDLAGLFPLRGNCHAILDVRVRLGLDQTKKERGQPALVLVRDGSTTSGLRAGHIVGRFVVDGSAIDLHDSTIPIHRELYSGVFELDGQKVPLMNLEVLLQDDTPSLLENYRKLREEERIPPRNEPERSSSHDNRVLQPIRKDR